MNRQITRYGWKYEDHLQIAVLLERLSAHGGEFGLELYA